MLKDDSTIQVDQLDIRTDVPKPLTKSRTKLSWSVDRNNQKIHLIYCNLDNNGKRCTPRGANIIYSTSLNLFFDKSKNRFNQFCNKSVYLVAKEQPEQQNSYKCRLV